MIHEELIPLILKRDERLLSILYDMYSKSLFSVVSNFLKETEDAEDVLQEVFIKIWKSIDCYSESKGRYYTWILNIARNTAIDKLRSKSYNNSQKNLFLG